MGFLKSLGPLELFLILLIVLVIFGVARLPEIGRGMGSAIRGFKDALTGKEEEKPSGKEGQVVSTASKDTSSAPSQQTDTKKPA
jgi:sec-independent protein translocase protein TatA